MAGRWVAVSVVSSVALLPIGTTHGVAIANAGTKAGVYDRNNSGVPDDYVQVKFQEPEASHVNYMHQADGGWRRAGADAIRRFCEESVRPIRFAPLEAPGPGGQEKKGQL